MYQCGLKMISHFDKAGVAYYYYHCVYSLFQIDIGNMVVVKKAMFRQNFRDSKLDL